LSPCPKHKSLGVFHEVKSFQANKFPMYIPQKWIVSQDLKDNKVTKINAKIKTFSWETYLFLINGKLKTLLHKQVYTL